MAQTADKSLISRLGWVKGTITCDKEDDISLKVPGYPPPAFYTRTQTYRSAEGMGLTPWWSPTQVKKKV